MDYKSANDNYYCISIRFEEFSVKLIKEICLVASSW